MYSIIKCEENVINGLSLLNQNNVKTLIVINSQNKVIGTATDGDIRRYLLKGGNVQDSIDNACNKSFNYCFSYEEGINLLDELKDKKILTIPLVDKNMKLLEVLNYENSKDRSDTVALIMAGGLGKRLRPLTKNIPKPLLPLNGRPIIETIIENIAASGIKKIFISIKYLGSKIKDCLGDGKNFGVEIQYLEEKEALGTAGCLKLLPKDIKTIFIINGDISTELSFRWIIDYHKINKSDMTIATRMFKYNVPFGVLTLEGDDIKNIEEKPIKSFPVAGGIYIVNYEKYKKLHFSSKEVYLDMPDLISKFLKIKATVRAFLIHEKWYDIGDVETYNQLNKN